MNNIVFLFLVKAKPQEKSATEKCSVTDLTEKVAELDLQEKATITNGLQRNIKPKTSSMKKDSDEIKLTSHLSNSNVNTESDDMPFINTDIPELDNRLEKLLKIEAANFDKENASDCDIENWIPLTQPMAKSKTSANIKKGKKIRKDSDKCKKKRTKKLASIESSGDVSPNKENISTKTIHNSREVNTVTIGTVVSPDNMSTKPIIPDLNINSYISPYAEQKHLYDVSNSFSETAHFTLEISLFSNDASSIQNLSHLSNHSVISVVDESYNKELVRISGDSKENLEKSTVIPVYSVDKKCQNIEEKKKSTYLNKPELSKGAHSGSTEPRGLLDISSMSDIEPINSSSTSLVTSTQLSPPECNECIYLPRHQISSPLCSTVVNNDSFKLNSPLGLMERLKKKLHGDSTYKTLLSDFGK